MKEEMERIGTGAVGHRARPPVAPWSGSVMMMQEPNSRLERCKVRIYLDGMLARFNHMTAL